MSSTPLFAYSASTPSISLDELMAKEPAPKKRVGLFGSMVIGTQIALQTVLGMATPAAAQDYQPTNVTEQAVAQSSSPNKHVMFLPNSPGINGAQWKSELVLSNPGEGTLEGAVRFTPVGATASDADPHVNYNLPPSVTSVITPASLGTGSWTATIIPAIGTAATATSRFWNEQDKDGNAETKTQLFGYVAAFKGNDAMLPGDTATFTLPSDGFRWNLGVLSTTGARFLVEAYDFNGLYRCASEHTTPAGGATQLVEYVKNACQPAQNMAILARGTARITVLEGDLFTQASSIQNNTDLPGVEDAGIEVPLIDRLLKAEYRVTPTTIEAGDTVVRQVTATSRTGTEIIGANVSGGLEGQVPHTGNTANLVYTSTPTVPGTYAHAANFIIRTADRGDFTRTINGDTLVATPAIDTVLDATSKATTKANINSIATILGDNVNAVFIQNNTHYPKADMVNTLTAYTDGIAGVQNPELDHVIIYGSNNKIDFRRTDGGTAVWGGLTRSQINQLRTIYNVTK